jgi:hypothetical protein
MAFQESSMGQYEIIVFKEFQGENQSLPCAFPIAFPAIICPVKCRRFRYASQQGNEFHYISVSEVSVFSCLANAHPKFTMEPT